MENKDRYIFNVDMLEQLYDAIHTTIDGKEIELFLSDYIMHKSNNNYIIEKDKYNNARKVLQDIDLNILKRELLTMLKANAKKSIFKTKIINKKLEKNAYITYFIKKLFYYSDENNIEYVFNKLYKIIPKELNKHIDDILKQMIIEKKYLNELNCSMVSWITKSYVKYSKKDLKLFERIREGKQRLKVVNTRKIQNSIKKLEKIYR